MAAPGRSVAHTVAVPMLSVIGILVVVLVLLASGVGVLNTDGLRLTVALTLGTIGVLASFAASYWAGRTGRSGRNMKRADQILTADELADRVPIAPGRLPVVRALAVQHGRAAEGAMARFGAAAPVVGAVAVVAPHPVLAVLDVAILCVMALFVVFQARHRRRLREFLQQLG